MAGTIDQAPQADDLPWRLALRKEKLELSHSTNQFGQRIDLQLLHHGGTTHFDSTFGNVQPGGDDFVGRSLQQHVQCLAFLIRQLRHATGELFPG